MVHVPYGIRGACYRYYVSTGHSSYQRTSNNKCDNEITVVTFTQPSREKALAEQKQLSMKDIARLAGVSIATVSRVINNNGRFSEETRQRVQRIIDENHYVANMAAKSLRESRTKTIGMIVPDISNDFFSTIALHTEQMLSQHGYSVFVCNTADDFDRETRYFRSLASKRVDGIVCISGSRALSENILPSNIPIVCVDRYPEGITRIPRVCSDDVHGGELATEHLLQRGCHHIVFLTSLASDLNKTNREIGYIKALTRWGIPFDATYCLRVTGKRPTMEEAASLVSQFMETNKPFDGIFAASDHAAVGALMALKHSGRNVPEDVKIIGFDDSIYSRLTSPTISSIQRFPEQLAHKGCEVLLQELENTGESQEPIPTETIVPVSLVMRESTQQN